MTFGLLALLVGHVVRQVSPVRQSVVTAKLVEVAFVVVAFVLMKLGNVELDVVVAVKNEPTISPTTESFAYGDVVPMPTLPEMY